VTGRAVSREAAFAHWQNLGMSVEQCERMLALAADLAIATTLTTEEALARICLRASEVRGNAVMDEVDRIINEGRDE
jgi:hypothetical protein